MKFINTLRGLLLASVATCPASALAQATEASEPGVAGGSAASEMKPLAAQGATKQSKPANEEIVVTGTRIKRPDFETPNPIVSFSAANIQQSGNTNITNFLQRVPALTASRDSTQTSGGNGTYGSFGQTGLNELNLRNLGTNRTLVLVNGRRHVAGEANTAAVDINSIPTDLIDRVDVLTGAISAIYGADGVTGVVNFILKRDFQGVAARAQSGISRYGDAGNRFASLAAGHNFADGQSNVTLAYEYNADGPVANDGRPFLRQSQRNFLIPNDAYDGINLGVPQNILVGDLRYGGESPIGFVSVGSLTFDGLGRPYNPGTPAAYYFTGGVGTEVAGFYQGDIFPKTERHAANLLGHYDFSDALKLSMETKYVQNRTGSRGQITGTYGVPISIDNPFVPTAIRNAAIAAGTMDDAGVLIPAPIIVSRDNIDYGRPGEEDLRRTYRGVIDASGRISDHATWDAYYEYGRTDDRITKIGDRLTKEYTDALDAVRQPGTGRTICNPVNGPGAGCIPISLFGPGPASANQLAYFTRDNISRASISQQVGSASISGDFGQFFRLPGGPVKFAFGGEYRRESSRFNPNADLVNARFFQYDEPGLVQASRGRFDVKEVFGEIDAPLFKDVPFASVLSVGAAGRYSHYSTIGNAKTWQFNGIWSPIRDITFRGSYGSAVRAPNIGELFQPTSSASNFFTDPCTPDQIRNGTQFRQANCTATLAAVGAVSTPALQTSQFVLGTSTGNRKLRAEAVRTWTAGLLLRPRFIPGLNASFDWYDINLKNAINTIDAGTLANLCVDQPTAPNQFCNQFTRAQGTGIINSFTVGPLNVAKFHTAGLDINIDYLIRTARAGLIDLRLVSGYLHKLEQVGIPGSPVTNNVDQASSPKWTVNFSPTWTVGRLSLSYNLRWYDATRVYDRNTTAASPNIAAPQYLRYSALCQHDAQMKAQIGKEFAFYLGVNNIANKKPDIYSYFTNIPISPLGRYYYAGARIDLGK